MDFTIYGQIDETILSEIQTIVNHPDFNKNRWLGTFKTFTYLGSGEEYSVYGYKGYAVRVCEVENNTLSDEQINLVNSHPAFAKILAISDCKSIQIVELIEGITFFDHYAHLLDEGEFKSLFLQIIEYLLDIYKHYHFAYLDQHSHNFMVTTNGEVKIIDYDSLESTNLNSLNSFINRIRSFVDNELYEYSVDTGNEMTKEELFSGTKFENLLLKRSAA